MIPKIIWQTHECPYEDLPELYKNNSKTYQDSLDGWEYRYHSALDRELFVSENFPEYLDLYQYIGPGIYKSDFWRYLVLYKFGGLYGDMDSIIDSAEDNIFYKSIIDPNSTFNVLKFSDEYYLNGTIMCSANHPIMKQIIDTMISKCKECYDQGFKVFPHGKWLWATGPEMYSSVIKDNLDKISNVYHYDGLSIKHGGIYKHQMDKDIYSNFHMGEY